MSLAEIEDAVMALPAEEQQAFACFALQSASESRACDNPSPVEGGFLSPSTGSPP